MSDHVPDSDATASEASAPSLPPALFPPGTPVPQPPVAQATDPPPPLDTTAEDDWPEITPPRHTLTPTVTAEPMDPNAELDEFLDGLPQEDTAVTVEDDELISGPASAVPVTDSSTSPLPLVDLEASRPSLSTPDNLVRRDLIDPVKKRYDITLLPQGVDIALADDSAKVLLQHRWLPDNQAMAQVIALVLRTINTRSYGTLVLSENLDQDTFETLVGCFFEELEKRGNHHLQQALAQAYASVKGSSPPPSLASLPPPLSRSSVAPPPRASVPPPPPSKDERRRQR